MTDIKEPINTTSDGTFLSVVCENPKKMLLAKSWGGCGPPAPPGITPLLGTALASTTLQAKPAWARGMLIKFLNVYS